MSPHRPTRNGPWCRPAPPGIACLPLFLLLAAPALAQPSSRPDGARSGRLPAAAGPSAEPRGAGEEPGRSATLVAEGDRLFGTQQRTAALQAYEQALAADPGNLEARFKQGVVLAVGGRSSEAIAAWEEVVAREPGHGPARQALLLARWKEAQEAQEAQGAAAEQPGLEEARRLVRAGSYARARQVLQRIPPRGEAYWDWMLLEGEALMGEGRAAEAAEAYRAALGHARSSAAALLGLGEAWRALGLLDPAAWCYELALTVAAGSDTLSLEQQRRARQILDRLAAAGPQ